MKHIGSVNGTLCCLPFIIIGINLFVSLCSLFGEGDPISLEIIENDYMRFVTQDVRNIWKNGDYLVAAGIPSIDNGERFRRRNLQRQTCWSYPEVARKSNNFTGKLLIVYALSPHTKNNCELREIVEEEAELNQDVIILPVCDVNPTTTKKIGDSGNWGWEAELTVSRKTYLWFKFAVEIFKATNPYIMKADDDIFMRVPLYLKYLYGLPREKLNMGRAVGYYNEFSDKITWHTIGYASTLSRDVVKELVDYGPLKKLVKSPIKFRNFEQYIDFRALNEDIMVGEVIRNKLKFKGLLTVDMKDCHYVMHVSRPLEKFVEENPKIIVFHHITSMNYRWLMEKFRNDSLAAVTLERPAALDRQWREFRCDKPRSQR